MREEQRTLDRICRGLGPARPGDPDWFLDLGKGVLGFSHGERGKLKALIQYFKKFGLSRDRIVRALRYARLEEEERRELRQSGLEWNKELVMLQVKSRGARLQLAQKARANDWSYRELCEAIQRRFGLAPGGKRRRSTRKQTELDSDLRAIHKASRQFLDLHEERWSVDAGGALACFQGQAKARMTEACAEKVGEVVHTLKNLCNAARRLQQELSAALKDCVRG